jgi:hypothetical protein
MAFDGSIEKINCITEHEDYEAMTNRAVLLQVCPLLIKAQRWKQIQKDNSVRK